MSTVQSVARPTLPCGHGEVHLSADESRCVRCNAPVMTEWERDLIDQAKASRTLALAKIDCAWCCDQAKWKITDPWAVDYACTSHGVEWYPELFTDHVQVNGTAEEIRNRQSNPVGVKATVQRPWYPLQGHRDGLRRNDLVSLASALFVLSLEGGTAHHGHCNGVAGEGCGICEGRL